MRRGCDAKESEDGWVGWDGGGGGGGVRGRGCLLEVVGKSVHSRAV